MAAGLAFVARRSCPGRAFARLCAGAFLPGALPALAAATDTTVALLVASEGAQDGEGQLEVVCEQPVFAAVRAVAPLPAGAPGEQDLLALLTDSGFVSILRFDAVLCRFVAVQQLALPPEPPGDPYRLLAVHPTGAAVAVASLMGSVCLAARQPAVPPNASGIPGSAASGSDGSPAGLFGSPVSLKLAHNLWSMAFETASASDTSAAMAAEAASPAAAAAAAVGAAPAEPIRLVALQQHPLSGAFAVAEYLCTAAAAESSFSARMDSALLQLTAFYPLECVGISSGSTSSSQPGSPSSRAGASGSHQLGQPRALVQLPPAAESWLPGAHLVLRESGVQLISSSMQPTPEQAAQAAERWWRQQDEQPAAATAATAAAEPATAEEAVCPQPMAVSLEQQPSLEGQLLRLRRQGSLEQLPDAWEESGEGDDVEMLEAAGSEAPGPAAAEAAAGAAGAADAAGGAADKAADKAAGEAAVSGSPPARSASAAGKAAHTIPASSSGQLVTCCCWQLDGQQPALVCALEDGSLWRLPLPSAAEYSGSGGSCLFPCPAPAPGSEQQQQQRTAPAARSIAAVPGGLLCACTDCSGLQLLQLRPSGAYEPLLPALASAQQAAAGWDASTAAAACTLPAAASVAGCALADLEGSGQAQVYAACCGTASSGGRLCVLYPDPKPETVFELPGAAEGITGLWGLRQRTADQHHSLALLSFLGGSRLLAAQGGIFRDVTDCYPLHASAQTLAVGNLRCPSTACTAGIAAQVTSQAVVLFATQPTAGMSRQASDALPVSAAPHSSSDASSSGVGAQPAWQPPAGCSIGAAVVADDAVLLFCTGSSRQLMVLLPGPSAAAGSSGPGSEAQLPQLVAAASMPLQADVSCISNLQEQAGAATAEEQPSEQQPGHAKQRSAVFAVGTYSSSVLLVQLSWEAAQPAAASLSLMQAVDLTASSIAGSISTAAAAAAAAQSAVPFSPRAFQREQLTPESLLVLPAPAVAAGAAAAGAAAAPAAAAATGGAALLLVGLRTGSLLQLLCSWGPQQAQQEELLAMPLGHMPAVLLPLPAQPSLATAAAGVPPPAAAALSDRVSLLHCPAAAAAGGGRLRCAPLALPQVQAAAPLLLESDNLANSTCMAPEAGWGGSEAALLTAFGSGSAPTGVQPPPQQLQLFLLCAASDGCLRMVSLDPQQVAASRCWPLPHDLQPSRLIAHPASGCVAVAGASSSLAGVQRARHRLAWETEEQEEEEGPVAAVQLLDPGTGDLLASYTGFMPDESITALAVWDPTHPGPQQPPPGSLASSIEAAGTQAAGATTTDAAAAAGAAAAGSGAEVPQGGFIVVGTTVGYGEPPGNAKARWGGAPQGPPRWDDETSLRLQGRLLLLQVATPTAASAGASCGGGAAAGAAVPAEAAGGVSWEPGLSEEQAPRGKLQLLAVAEMHLPNRVLALCSGSTRVLSDRSSSSGGGGSGRPQAAEPRLFVSVGRRLVSLEWRARQQMLRRVAWVPTARPITSLQLSGGLLAAADRREGVTLYRYFEPEPSAEAPPPHPDQRGRLARRYRLAPPAAGELRHRLGLMPQRHIRDGVDGTADKAHSVAGQGQEPEEELEPGFSVVAADTCCRPAVGALVVPAAASTSQAGGNRAAAPATAAAAAAVLDAHGELCVLQQRWPGQQAALHGRCRFLLHEPATALLPGSLGYLGEAAGGGALLGAAAPPAAAGAATEMAAVTLGGSVLSLRPVDAADAAQLAALQRALASHPATAPLSGGSHAAYRGWEASGPAVPAVPLLFRHPVPAGAKEGGAEADLLPPASPSGAVAAAQEGLLGSAMTLEPAAPEAEAGPGAEAHLAAGSSTSRLPAGATGLDRSVAAAAAAGTATAAQPMDVILDGELLRQFLLLQPAEQRAVVAGMRSSGVASGSDLAAAELRRTTQRLNNLVASLML